jgi:hypothetical protein
MAYGYRCLLLLGILGYALGAAAQQPSQPQLNARELFYNTAPGPAPAAKAADKPVTQAKANTKRKKSTTAPAVASEPPATAVAHNALPSPPTGTSSPTPAPVPVAGGAQVIPAALVEPGPATPPAPALGLKYTILKIVDNEPMPVAADTVFHAGDRVRFSVEPNGPGYLYIVQQGSSGTWQPIFPSPDLAGSSNRVEGWQTYVMPPKSRLVFDEQTGTERIFIVLSRGEVPDLERLIYSLKGGSAEPVSQPQAPAKPQVKTMMASLQIDDATVGRLRNAYARDLIIEKVDDSTPGDRKEKAVYVVNPTGSADSRLVADIQLVHQ